MLRPSDPGNGRCQEASLAIAQPADLATILKHDPIGQMGKGGGGLQAGGAQGEGHGLSRLSRILEQSMVRLVVPLASRSRACGTIYENEVRQPPGTLRPPLAFERQNLNQQGDWEMRQGDWEMRQRDWEMRRLWESFDPEVRGVVFWPTMIVVIGILTVIGFSHSFA